MEEKKSKRPIVCNSKKENAKRRVLNNRTRETKWTRGRMEEYKKMGENGWREN